MPGRILVIDDEPQITRVLRAALSAQGYDVRTANEPEEGLQVFNDWTPDLIVTDLMMPRMDGFELLRRLQAGHDRFQLRALEPKLPEPGLLPAQAERAPAEEPRREHRYEHPDLKGEHGVSEHRGPPVGAGVRPGLRAAGAGAMARDCGHGTRRRSG